MELSERKPSKTNRFNSRKMVPKCCQANKFADSSLDFEYRKENNKEITITCEN